MGLLHADPGRGKEIFSFEYDEDCLAQSMLPELDPELALFGGPQFPARANFGLFLDSCPDRWGRVLMRRREAQRARADGRPPQRLLESDYLLGVHDSHRMGALRFRVDGVFASHDVAQAAPPWTSLRELEHASLQLEREDAEQDPHYARWLSLLIAPGASLGGARPKASVLDSDGALWLAKFPSVADLHDIGAWEAVVHELAQRGGLDVPEAQCQRFTGKHHAFLSRRFDRCPEGRLHFASAMTLLERSDGSGSDGASYLELAELLIRSGARTGADLEGLWRRILFSVCVSNTDDHLRNHGFLLEPGGWTLAPAYDLNPNPYGSGLSLNISESDNAQDLDLVDEVAVYFRVARPRAAAIRAEVVDAVRGWRAVASARGLSRSAQDRMAPAFRLVDQAPGGAGRPTSSR